MTPAGLPSLGFDMKDHLSLLTNNDRRAYEALHQEMRHIASRTTHDQLGKMFKEIIARIHQFAVRNDSNDGKRCFVCGIVWFENALGISTRQLTKLVGRCKSSINAGLQSFGYATVPTTPEHLTLLVRALPFLRENANEMRQWTIRHRLRDISGTELTKAEPEAAPGSRVTPFDGFDLNPSASLFDKRMTKEVDYTKFLSYDELTMYGFVPMNPDSVD
jgi:hypothetical protein